MEFSKCKDFISTKANALFVFTILPHQSIESSDFVWVAKREMDIAALSKKYDHEGYMLKSASSKGKDVLRKGLLGKSTFKERYFAMKDKTLTYYKQKGDQKYLDLIDLEFATVENGDHVTGKPFTLRIAQAKMVYTYLVCDSQSSYNSWLPALRWAAGYEETCLHDDKIKEKKALIADTFTFYAPLVHLYSHLLYPYRLHPFVDNIMAGPCRCYVYIWSFAAAARPTAS